jgi:hypothetical protein
MNINLHPVISQLSTKYPTRHKAMGRGEVYFHSFLTSGLEVSGRLHTSDTSIPRKEAPAPTAQGGGWAPELLWTLWRRSISPVLAWNRTTSPWSSSPYPTTLSRLKVWMVFKIQLFWYISCSKTTKMLTLMSLNGQQNKHTVLIVKIE